MTYEKIMASIFDMKIYLWYDISINGGVSSRI